MTRTDAGRAIGTAAAIIMAGNLTSSVLGFARQAVIANVFGATRGTDAFVAASIVPQMFYDLTIGAAISAALIPTFTELAERGDRDKLWRTVGTVLALAWLVLATVIVILALSARPLMTVLLWGYHTHLRTGALDLAIEMARIIVPTLFFLGTSAVLLSVLYSLRRFTAPAFASTLYHVGIIAGAAFLARPLGVLCLPVGALAGAGAQVAFQIPAFVRARPALSFHLELTPEVRRILRLYLPVAAGLLVSIVGQVIDLAFKSQLRTGSIYDMQVATTLTQFPIGIAVAALSFAVLPSISADAAFDRIVEFKDTLALGLKLVLFITVPAAVGYLVLASPIVALLFRHHAFTAVDTSSTATALAGYAIQIPFVGIDQLLIFSFYARKNTVTPMLIGVLGVCIYVASALLLLPRLHILGLALSNTIQNSLHGIILLIILVATMGTFRGRGIGRSVTTTLLCALLMAIGAAAAGGLVARLSETRLIDQAIHVALPLAVGALLYVGAAAALRSEELRFIRRLAGRHRAAPNCV